MSPSSMEGGSKSTWPTQGLQAEEAVDTAEVEEVDTVEEVEDTPAEVEVDMAVEDIVVEEDKAVMVAAATKVEADIAVEVATKVVVATVGAALAVLATKVVNNNSKAMVVMGAADTKPVAHRSWFRSIVGHNIMPHAQFVSLLSFLLAIRVSFHPCIRT